MTSLFCPSCGTEILAAATHFCANCGASLTTRSARASRLSLEPDQLPSTGIRLTSVFWLVALLAIIVLAVYFEHGSQAATESRSTLAARLVTVNIPLGSRDVVVPPGSYSWVKFTINPSEAGARWVVGHYATSGGSGNDIQVLLMDSDGFLNFKNRHAGTAYYSTGKETAGQLNVGPLAAGTFYLVFNNGFSLVSNKVVQNGIDLRSSPGQ